MFLKRSLAPDGFGRDPVRRPSFPIEAIGVGLVALFARADHLGVQSLWYDEGTSAQLTRHGVADILTAAANDIHPPLYYLLLAGWTRLAGDSEWSLRVLSLFAGTLVVLGIWRLSRRAFGRPAALATGLTAAFSPFLVWYAQEARMYSLAAWWTVFLVLILTARRLSSGRRLAAAILVTTAALYTHYLGGICALGLVLFVPHRAFSARSRVIAWLVPLAAFLPWLARAWPTLRDWPATSAPFGPGFLAHASVIALSYGEHLAPLADAMGPLLPWTAGVGLLGTAWACRRRPDRDRSCRYRDGLLTVLVWLMLPLVILGLLSIRKPAWQAKQIIMAAPAFELALGLGAWRLGRWVARRVPGSRPDGRGGPGRLEWALTAGLALVLVAPRLASIALTQEDPREQRDDYRGIAREIAAESGPHDAVILDAPTQVEVFDYYNRGRLATYPLPVGRPVDQPATRRALDAVAARGGDVWAVLWATEQADPDRLVEGWLNRRYFKVSERWQGRLRFARWAAPAPANTSALTATPTLSETGTATAPASPKAEVVRFGDRLELSRLEHDPLLASPGAVFRLAATWQVVGEGPGAAFTPLPDYTVFVHLRDAAGRLVAQRDLPPLGGLQPTSRWRPGEALVDRIGLALPRTLPAGTYTLVFGWYDPSRPDLARLAVAGPRADETGTAFVVGRLTVR